MTTTTETQINSDWKILDESGKARFLKILKILNQYPYYFEKKSNPQLFRERLVEVPECSIQIRKFDKFHFLIQAHIGSESQTWIHADGIAEERSVMLAHHEEAEAKKHPAFKIDCVSDIYESIYTN